MPSARSVVLPFLICKMGKKLTIEDRGSKEEKEPRVFSFCHDFFFRPSFSFEYETKEPLGNEASARMLFERRSNVPESP